MNLLTVAPRGAAPGANQAVAFQVPQVDPTRIWECSEKSWDGGGVAIRQGPNYKSARTGTMYWGSQVHLFEFVITNDDAQRVYARHALGWSCFYRHWQGTNTISFELSQVQPEGLDRFEPMRASGLQRMCSQAHCLRPPIRGCQSTIHDTPACGKSYCEHHLWYGSSGDKSREAYSCPQCCKIYFERKGPVGQGGCCIIL